MPQIERKAKLLAHVRRGVPQSSQCRFVLLLVTFNSHINAGIAEVIGDANFSNGNHCQSRILQLVANNLRNLFSQRFSDALRTMHNQCKFRVSSREFRDTSWKQLETPNSKLETSLQLRGRDLLDHISFDLIANFDVVEVFQSDAALKAFPDFGNVIFEPAQRSYIAFPANDAVTNQARARVAADVAVDDHAARDGADFGNAKDFAHVRFAENLFFLDLLEHADHRRLNFFLDLVDDRV